MGKIARYGLMYPGVVEGKSILNSQCAADHDKCDRVKQDYQHREAIHERRAFNLECDWRSQRGGHVFEAIVGVACELPKASSQHDEENLKRNAQVVRVERKIVRG